MSDTRPVQTLPDPPATLLSYADALTALDGHPLRRRDVPTEYELSLPVPTRRWATPAFAVFAGAAVRRPHAPKRLAAPDRWWAVDVHRGRLLAYGLTAALPFADTPLSGPVVVPPISRSVDAVAADHDVLARLMDRALPAFLDPATTLPAALHTDLGRLWDALVPDGCADWYRALAPDFFSWLDTGGTHG